MLHQWGSHKNQIWKTENSKTVRFEAGRATTFSDKIGQRDHVLKKGDAATSKAYDNCAYGTKLEVVAPKKGGGIATKNSV